MLYNLVPSRAIGIWIHRVEIRGDIGFFVYRLACCMLSVFCMPCVFYMLCFVLHALFCFACFVYFCMLIPSTAFSASVKGSEIAKRIQRNMFDCLDAGFESVSVHDRSRMAKYLIDFESCLGG